MDETRTANRSCVLGSRVAWQRTSARLAEARPPAMADGQMISMSMASEHENVLLVREVLTGVAEALDLDAVDLEDMLTVVSEACNNVVLHAYPGGVGPLEFGLGLGKGGLEATVRDHGEGVNPRLRSARTHVAGIGIPVMQSLARGVEFRRPREGDGTEVCIEFATSDTPALHALSADRIPAPPELVAEAGTTATIAHPCLLRTVLPRLLGVLAAQANFSTNRLSDVHMLADALAAHAPNALEGDNLSLVATLSAGSLEVWIGPLSPARADQLLRDSEIPPLGSVIERLTNERSMSPPGAGISMLTLKLLDRE